MFIIEPYAAAQFTIWNPFLGYPIVYCTFAHTVFSGDAFFVCPSRKGYTGGLFFESPRNVLGDMGYGHLVFLLHSCIAF